MKNAPQHACDECNEMLVSMRWLKHELMRVKRLPVHEIPLALNELQVRAGAMETQMVGMKGWVCAAFATSSVREVSDRVVPRVPQFPERGEAEPGLAGGAAPWPRLQAGRAAPRAEDDL